MSALCMILVYFHGNNVQFNLTRKTNHLMSFYEVYILNPKQLINGSVVNFICETKSVSKQDVLIMVT